MIHKGQVTIRDITRELGISPSTVSKALKGLGYRVPEDIAFL